MVIHVWVRLPFPPSIFQDDHTREESKIMLINWDQKQGIMPMSKSMSRSFWRRDSRDNIILSYKLDPSRKLEYKHITLKLNKCLEYENFAKDCPKQKQKTLFSLPLHVKKEKSKPYPTYRGWSKTITNKTSNHLQRPIIDSQV